MMSLFSHTWGEGCAYVCTYMYSTFWCPAYFTAASECEHQTCGFQIAINVQQVHKQQVSCELKWVHNPVWEQVHPLKQCLSWSWPLTQDFFVRVLLAHSLIKNITRSYGLGTAPPGDILDTCGTRINFGTVLFKQTSDPSNGATV